MNLKHALLCIDCDEVFTAEASTCNPRCPTCGSSVYARLDGWVQTWTAFEKSLETIRRARHASSAKQQRMKIVPVRSVAA